ncbi:MAG: hypothetical protein EZS28_041096, partial [Streblomastix strix]
FPGGASVGNPFIEFKLYSLYNAVQIIRQQTYFTVNGTSVNYSRHDHVHPQQLTYDGNVTATKFIKTGGLATEILCANGDTTTIDQKLSRSYNSSGGGWIRLCVFPGGASVGNPFIEFKLYSLYNAVQIIRQQTYFTVNGINTIYGVFTTPTRVTSYYLIDNGANQLFHTHTGKGTAAIYSAYIRLETVGSITVVVTDQSTYFTNRITEILTQDVVSSVPSGTQIPLNYNYGYGGIMQNTLQVNPIERMKSNYNNGIRIETYVSESSLYLALVIQQLVEQQQDNENVGLSINSDSSKITFNGNELVNVGTDQTIIGVKAFAGVTYVESTGSAAIQFGCSKTANTGQIAGQWAIFTPPSYHVNNPLGFKIQLASESGNNTRGLQISPDGNTLTFNGSVIAGVGATNGASNGSDQYSAGNPILWGVNSTGTEGGFCSNGINICCRARPVTLGSVHP